MMLIVRPLVSPLAELIMNPFTPIITSIISIACCVESDLKKTQAIVTTVKVSNMAKLRQNIESGLLGS